MALNKKRKRPKSNKKGGNKWKKSQPTKIIEKKIINAQPHFYQTKGQGENGSSQQNLRPFESDPRKKKNHGKKFNKQAQPGSTVEIEKQPTSFTIHNVRFYDFEPKAIQCMCYEEETNRLALSRADGTIEIWNCSSKPFMQQILPGDDDSSVEGVVWCGGRLFSAGLHGYILEHNINTGEVLSRTAVTGGPTWCIALSPDRTKIAAGTEEGFVCLFDVVDCGIVYNKNLERQEGRILHLSWHSSGDYIVTGSINCVRLWSLNDGRMTRCGLGHSEDQEIIVWCVGILDDMTIVSGDSRGKICFWNGRLGMVTESLQTHKADVQTLFICADQKTIYVAGVDPEIVQVDRVMKGGRKSGSKLSWVTSIRRCIHTHDVRALVCTADNKMYSGGVDTILALSYYPPKTLIRFRAHPPRGSMCVAGGAGSVLLRYRDRLELWRLGGAAPPSEYTPITSQFLPIEEDRVKLLEIRGRSGEVMDWCAMSHQGRWITYIVNHTLRIYQFWPPSSESQASVRRVRGVSDDVRPSHQAVWLGEAKLASATTNGSIQIISLSEIEATVERELCLKPGCHVVLMTASIDGHYLVVVDNKNQVMAFNITANSQNTGDDSEAIQLPLYDVPVTAVGIHPKSRDIVVAHADMMIKEYNLNNRRYTKFHHEVLTTPHPDLIKRSSVINNISFHTHKHNLILLHDAESIIILDREKTNNYSRYQSTNNQHNHHSSDSSNSNSFKVKNTGAFSFVPRSNQVLHLSYVKEDSMVSVELNPLQLLDKLPPTLKIKKYGGM